MYVNDLIRKLPQPVGFQLPAPVYRPRTPYTEIPNHVALGVASMRQHMTDEGYQLMLALEAGGYGICGKDWPYCTSTDVERIVNYSQPTTLILQDKREWEGRTAGPGFDTGERFTNVQSLKDYDHIFKLTVLKDAQNQPAYHAESAAEIGCHAWIVYYHPRIVCHLAPFVRPQHTVRTYHTIDRFLVRPYTAANRSGALLSGAVSGAYPWRQYLVNHHTELHQTTYLKHPGYHRSGSNTPGYIELLSKYRVAICTASKYGYALRKIIEATAAGCIVVTDLPQDEVLPEIDGNLIRVESGTSVYELNKILDTLYDHYNPRLQAEYAQKCLKYYDYRAMGVKLAADVETMRLSYCSTYTGERCVASCSDE